MNAAAVLPLAFVMIAGPQIVSSVFFATSVNWKGTSAAYVLGGAISVTAFYSIAYFVAKATNSGGFKSGSFSPVLDGIVLVILLVLVVYVFLNRKNVKQPKWMEKLQTATPKFAFFLGLALLGVFPTDILSSVAVGLHLASHQAPWVAGIPFVVLTLLLLGSPAILVLVLGQRARERLPAVRQWMNTNSWIVSEIVLVFFIVIEVNSLWV